MTEQRPRKPIGSRWQKSTNDQSPPIRQLQQQGLRRPVQSYLGQPPQPIGRDVHSGENVALPADNSTMGRAIVGGTGTGKSSLIRSLVQMDAAEGITSIVLDPHGELATELVASLPSNQVLYITPDNSHPWGINLYECPDYADPRRRDLTLDAVVGHFRKQWSEGEHPSWGPRLEDFVINTALTVMPNRMTMAEIPLLFRNKQLRDKLLARVDDPYVHEFWHRYDELRGYIQVEWSDSTINKLRGYLNRQTVYRIVSQSRTSIRWPELFNSGKVIVVSLPIGEYGETTVNFIGNLLLSTLVLSVYQRGTSGREIRLYIDEFARWSSPWLHSFLTQCRKYRVGTTISMQTLADLVNEHMREAVLQMGTLISLNVTGRDAEILSKEYNATPPPGNKEYKMRMKPVYGDNGELIDHQPAIEQDFWQREKFYEKLYGDGQQHWYEEVEGQRRTIADMENEIANKLRTAGRFQAFVKTHGNESTIEHHIKLTPPPPATGGYQQLQEAQERGRRLFGRSWEEVKAEIATRQFVEEPPNQTGRQAQARHEKNWTELDAPRQAYNTPMETVVERKQPKPKQPTQKVVREEREVVNSVTKPTSANTIIDRLNKAKDEDRATAILRAAGELYIITPAQTARLYEWKSLTRLSVSFTDLSRMKSPIESGRPKRPDKTEKELELFRVDRHGIDADIVSGDGYVLLPPGVRWLTDRKEQEPTFWQELNKAKKLNGAFTHTLLVNEVLINLALLERYNGDVFMTDGVLHERLLHSRYGNPQKRLLDILPDGFIRYKIYTGRGWVERACFLELEHKTQTDRAGWQEKVRLYLELLSDMNRLDKLFRHKKPFVLALCTDPERPAVMNEWTEEILSGLPEYTDRFRIGALDLSLSPEQFFCSKRFFTPFREEFVTGFGAIVR